jgi:uncharacterized protein (DUF1778 family)
MKTSEKSRFDTRLTKDQKEYFEYAAQLGGFRTLTDFVLISVQEKAKKIVEDHELILASKRDQKIFFQSVMNPQKPNEKLKKAALNYKKRTSV